MRWQLRYPAAQGRVVARVAVASVAKVNSVSGDVDVVMEMQTAAVVMQTAAMVAIVVLHHPPWPRWWQR